MAAPGFAAGAANGNGSQSRAGTPYPLTLGYPDLERLGVEWYTAQQAKAESNIASVLRCVERLIDLSVGLRTFCEIGCGPNPGTLLYLRRRGLGAVGIEPIPAYVRSACDTLEDPGAVVQGTAERIPLPDGSQRVVLCENVLEHVDSPGAALREMFRVLVPGGLLYLYTSNRYHFSLLGRNGEFRLPFYNWYPALLKESYIFKHLHTDPSLAMFTPRPAVHWYSYADLCRRGRDAGFSQFYSPLDVADAGDSFVQRGMLRRRLIALVRRNAWMRSLALVQFGSAIFMWQRGTGSPE